MVLTELCINFFFFSGHKFKRQCRRILGSVCNRSQEGKISVKTTFDDDIRRRHSTSTFAVRKMCLSSYGGEIVTCLYNSSNNKMILISDENEICYVVKCYFDKSRVAKFILSLLIEICNGHAEKISLKCHFKLKSRKNKVKYLN